MDSVSKWLNEIDRTIENGKYKDDWESLSTYPVAEWYAAAKFGIFIHWGAYSVPAYKTEWYPRQMYYRLNPVYAHHKKTYGTDFPYRMFIDMFTAPLFDADKWMSAIKNSGARFVMPVAEHHDGYKMYSSRLSRWTTEKQAMHRDVLGELKEAAERYGLEFATSSHRAEHYWFMNGAATLHTVTEERDPEYADLYGPLAHVNTKNDLKAMLDGEKNIVPSLEWMEEWLAHTAELVTNYRPSGIYFDWWVHHPAFRPYMKKFMAYYYNKSAEWGKEVVVQYKYDAAMYGSAIYDRERGQMDTVMPRIWQSDTATSKNAWCHTTTNRYKTPAEIARAMADVLSKNGVFVLNIGPKADGTLAPEDENILASLGEWTRANRNALFGAVPYRITGEGKKFKLKGFKENLNYSSRDFRYTYRPCHIYAFALKPNKSGVYKLTKLNRDRDNFAFTIKNVTLLASGEKLEWEHTRNALTIKTAPPSSPMPLVLDIEID